MIAGVSRLRVLIIDDDVKVCEYLQELLTPDGCEVVAIHEPEQGLTMLKAKETFHIMILDLKMPGINGIQLLEQIRKIDRDVAVIILTAYPSLESATDAINLDVSAYMQKPFSGEDMRETHVTFLDLESMQSALSPRRLELLRHVRQHGATSVRGLAAALERDYKNVHQDVAALELAGLLVRDGRKLAAPWDELQASVALA